MIERLLFLLCLTVTCPLSAQEQSIKEKMYLSAYEYVIKDSVNVDTQIYVIDSIVDLDRFWFIDLLKEYPKELELAKNHRQNKNFHWDENTYSPMLNSLFSEKNKGAHMFLMFSDIEDNMLVAENIIRKRRNGIWDPNTDISWISRFTQGYSYLFIFNDDGSIKDVFRQLINYD